MRSAPRIGDRLRREIESHASAHVPIAEIGRRVGETAERLGVPRPSYERVRTLVHEARRLRYQNTAGVLVDVTFRTAPPTAVVEHLSGTRSRRR